MHKTRITFSWPDTSKTDITTKELLNRLKVSVQLFHEHWSVVSGLNLAQGTRETSQSLFGRGD